MAIAIETNDPTKLLNALKTAIHNGHIVTWSINERGDFTHNPPQWNNQAFLRPSVSPGILTMNIVGNARIITTPVIYAVYHGRFIEAVLSHFDKMFFRSTATAMPTNADICTVPANLTV